jgi:GAF domain-containing protein
MNPDRWKVVDQLYHAARSRPPMERPAFLAEACGGDQSLRHEVESLLEIDPSADRLFSDPALEAAAAALRESIAARIAAEVGEPEPAVGPSAGDRTSLPFWARAVVVIATIQTAAALAVYLSTGQPARPTAPIPAWVYAAVSATFTALGVALAFGSRNDPRAGWLGAVLVLTGTPFATRLIQADIPTTFGWLAHVRPDAFWPACLWSFLVHFPSELSGRPRSFVRGVSAFAAVIAVVLMGVNLAEIWLPRETLPVWLAVFLNPTTTVPDGSYWLIVLGMTLPALLALLWRAARAERHNRARVRLFVFGLFVGSAPFNAEVLVEESWPAYKVWAHGPALEPFIGGVIFGALAVVPFVTAYSVLFDRIVDVRVALHAALQYVLARYMIVGATLIPFAALALFLFQHRSEPMSSLAGGLRPVLLGVFAVAGAAAVRLRRRWILAVDRRYFREPYDARDILTRLAGSVQPASVGELAAIVRTEIDRSLHAQGDLFVLDELRHSFRHADDRLAPIGAESTLITLVGADRRPMDVDLRGEDSPLGRLSTDDRRWLERGGFHLLVPIRRAEGVSLGILALSAKQSGLPYSAEDRSLVSVIAAAAALALDRLRSDSDAQPASSPGRECRDCARLSPIDAKRCACGGELTPASVPFVLRGVFQFERRIGAGGMGVVYKAVDLNLGRDVAIKALPRTSPELIARLRREARAMAAVSHPNLAVIHGVETWQGVPLLVQEFLAGGTLAERLANARPDLDDVIDLGITLADVLHYLHTSGVIHCDIKPSNIGFTQLGVVKLLDFGLARVMREVRAATVPTFSNAADPSVRSADQASGWFGTPQFMSPEAARGERPAPSFDLWALAVVLFEAVADRRPFDGPSPLAIFAQVINGPTPDIRDIRPGIPASIAAFFADALAQNPARRPADAAQFASHLRGLRAQN